MTSLRKKVRQWAIITRIFVLVMQAFFNIFIYDHDAGDVFRTPINEESTTAIDWIFSFLIGGLGNWDGQYFIHIAKYGYSYENCLVFFPLLPSIMNVITNTLGIPVYFILSRHYGMLFIGVCVNFITFVISAEILYELSRRVLKEERQAYCAALLYCINPATIFFSAVYSEALFATFTFLGMLLYEKKEHVYSALSFAIASASRANGIVACGFMCYQVLKELTHLLEPQKGYLSLTSKWMLIYIVKKFFGGFVNIFLIIAPFLAHQIMAYKTFCMFISNNSLPPEAKAYGISQGYHFPSYNPPEWCNQRWPLSYSHIQSEYWNVGFLNYYQWKQIPNFLLAFPTILCILGSANQYIKKNWNFCLHLGLTGDDMEISEKNKCIGIMNPRCFLYFAHASILVVFGCLFMHVQVITRMLCSSSPVLYWYAASVIEHKASLIPVNFKSRNPNYDAVIAGRVETTSNLVKLGDNRLSDEIQQWKNPTLLSNLIKIYFLSYFVLGSAMFVNYYPFT